MRSLEKIEHLDSIVAPTIQELAVAPDAQQPDDTGPPCTLAIGSDIRSGKFQNVTFSSFESTARACAGLISKPAKDLSYIHCNGSLITSGARRQVSIAAFDMLMLDCDKGFSAMAASQRMNSPGNSASKLKAMRPAP